VAVRTRQTDNQCTAFSFAALSIFALHVATGNVHEHLLSTRSDNPRTSSVLRPRPYATGKDILGSSRPLHAPFEHTCVNSANTIGLSVFSRVTSEIKTATSCGTNSAAGSAWIESLAHRAVTMSRVCLQAPSCATRARLLPGNESLDLYATGTVDSEISRRALRTISCCALERRGCGHSRTAFSRAEQMQLR
jgi:hypothetical protein